MLIDGREKVEIEILRNQKVVIHYLQSIDDVCENLEDYHPTNKSSVLVVIHDMIADMECNQKLSTIVSEITLRGRKLHISLAFISKSYFKMPKTIT